MKKPLITFLALALLVGGCSKDLDKAPLPSITPENFFKNADDAEAALAAVYDVLQNGDGGFGNDIICAGEMPSDNCTSVNGDVTDLDRIAWTPQTTQVRRIFAVIYTGLNRANAVLKYVPGIAMPDARKNQILGEARFLRALNYFTLVQLYGGVPLRLDPVESADPAVTNLARATAEQVYAQVLADLTEAEQLTPASYGSPNADRTRATKAAVNALQARVLLTQRQWTAAQAAAAKVVALASTYPLASSFNALFPAENNRESIFEVQFSGTATDGGNSLPDLILPAPPAYYAFDKYNIPTAELITYADTLNDLRWKYVGTVTGLRNHVSYVDSKVPGGGNQGPFAYKWRTTPVLAFNSPDNTYLLRYAEVLLTYAEAANEQAGPTADALGKLNQVRQRAGLAALTLASPQAATKAALRNEIDRQRRLEFAFEGMRWFDLLRYARHTQADPAAQHAVTALTLIQQKRTTADANYLLFPIPQNELNVNKQAVQNPGY